MAGMTKWKALRLGLVAAALCVSIVLLINTSAHRRELDALNLWTGAYTSAMADFTDKAYRCTSEIRSQRYDPVDSGPACRATCEVYDKVNVLVNRYPYAEKERYRLEPLEMCDVMKRRAKGE